MRYTLICVWRILRDKKPDAVAFYPNYILISITDNESRLSDCVYTVYYTLYALFFETASKQLILISLQSHCQRESAEVACEQETNQCVYGLFRACEVTKA